MHRKAFKPKTCTHTLHKDQQTAVQEYRLYALQDDICVTLVSRQSPASVFILKEEDYVDAKGKNREELNSIC